MRITIEQLQALDACKEGIAAFRNYFGEIAEQEWTREKQLEIINSPLRVYFGWAVNNGLIPIWSMSDANLSGADLSRAYLSRANLSRYGWVIENNIIKSAK